MNKWERDQFTRPCTGHGCDIDVTVNIRHLPSVHLHGELQRAVVQATIKREKKVK